MSERKVSRIQHFCFLMEAILVIPLGTILSFLPRRMIPSLSLWAGALAFYLNRKNRKLAFSNLEILFSEPPPSQSERDRIIKTLFVNIAAGLLQYLQLGKIEPESLPGFLEAQNHKAVEEALREKRGVLVLTAHLGNWEYLGVLGSRLGYDVATVLKRQHNPYTDRWLAKIREGVGGVKCFYHGHGLQQLISRHLKHNGILALVADQRDISSSLIVPLFGVPCLTADGPARLHLWYESPLVFAFSIKQPDGRYLLEFDGPYSFEKKSDFNQTCIDIMAFINKKYEKIIRQYPEQWFSLVTPRWRLE